MHTPFHLGCTLGVSCTTLHLLLPSYCNWQKLGGDVYNRAVWVTCLLKHFLLECSVVFVECGNVSVVHVCRMAICSRFTGACIHTPFPCTVHIIRPIRHNLLTCWGVTDGIHHWCYRSLMVPSRMDQSPCSNDTQSSRMWNLLSLRHHRTLLQCNLWWYRMFCWQGSCTRLCYRGKANGHMCMK